MIRRRAAARAVAAAAMLVATTAPAGAEPSPGAWVQTAPPAWPFHTAVYAFPDGTAYAWTGMTELRLRSRDFGVTWTRQPPQPPHTLEVRYGNPKDGYVFGGGGECGSECNRVVYRTRDGGETWRAATRLPAPPRGVYQTHIHQAVAPSGRTVVVPLRRRPASPPCPAGRLLGPKETFVAVTRDGARTWSLGRIPTWVTARDVTMFDDLRGAIAVTEAWVPNGSLCTPHELVRWSTSLWLTRDGGRTWGRAPARCVEYCASVTYASPTRILVGDSSHTVHVSDDGGATFRPSPLGVATAHGWVTDLSFADADTGWASTFGSGIWHTTDGGRTWLPELSPASAFLAAYGLSAANRTRAVAAWAGGIVARVGPSPQ